MILSIVFSLFLCSANTLDVNVAFGMIKSALEYYNSYSVLLIFDESLSSSDLFKMLTLQKRLSSGNNFYSSSITSPASLLKSLRNYHQSPRETVMIWNPDEEFPHIIEKVSNEIDITSHKWFVTTSSLNSEAFNNVTIPLHSEFTIAKGNPQSGYSLEEIYDVIPEMRLSNPLGRWFVNSQEFQLQVSAYMFKRRKDFQGATMKLASYAEDACNIMSLLKKGSAMATCSNQLVWYMLAEVVNAKTEVLVVPELTAATIIQEAVDLTIRSGPNNADHMSTRDYVWPTLNIRLFIAIRLPPEEVRWETFMLPFRFEMWMLIFGWVILWDFILAFVQFLNLENKKKTFFGYYNEFSFSTFFTFCSQGIFCSSKSSSTRIILLLMFIAPAVLFRGYSAVLTSFLTVQVDKKPFRNIEELSQNSEYKLGWQNAFHMEDLMNLKSMSPLTEALLKNNILPRDKLPTSDVEGLEKMCNEKFSYLVSEASLVANKPRCRYYTLDQSFTLLRFSLELKKGSWYKYYLDRGQRIITYSGNKMKVIYKELLGFVNFETIATVDESEVHAIKMENIILPFVVLLMGVIASVIVLILENIFFRI